MPKVDTHGRYFHENKRAMSEEITTIKVTFDFLLSPLSENISIHCPAIKQMNVTDSIYIRDEKLREPI